MPNATPNPAAPVHAFHVMTKPIGPICNLDCQYCFYLEKENLYPDTKDFRMRDDVLAKYVRDYIERQDVPVVGNFVEITRIPSQTPGFATGGNNWTDTSAQPSRCYNYRVAAYNASGMSLYNVNGPVQMCTTGTPGAPY